MMNTTSIPSQQALKMELKEKAGEAEKRGDLDWMAVILGPRLAFQRADDEKTVDDQVAFLQKVKAGSKRATRIIESIELFRTGKRGGRFPLRESRSEHKNGNHLQGQKWMLTKRASNSRKPIQAVA